MRLATIKLDQQEAAAVVLEKGVVSVEAINKLLNTNWPINLLSIIQVDKDAELAGC